MDNNNTNEAIDYLKLFDIINDTLKDITETLETFEKRIDRLERFKKNQNNKVE